MSLDFNKLISEALERGQVDHPQPDDLSQDEQIAVMYELDSNLAQICNNAAAKGLDALNISTVLATFAGGAIAASCDSTLMAARMAKEFMVTLAEALKLNLDAQRTIRKSNDQR